MSPQDFHGLLGHDLAALGIPDEATQRATDLARGGRAPGDNGGFIMVFNMFRLAAILRGILARALQGNAAAADALATGERARRMAEAGWRLASG